MANTILTQGQRKLHTGLMATGIFLLANAAYLFLTSKPLAEMKVLPGFYQWMLVAHVVIGTLLLVPMVVFVVWHMRRALAMQNRTAVWTGVLLTTASFALFVTGLFLFTKANSVENRWAFIGHRALALVAPAAYVYHRFVAHHKPLRWAVLAGAISPFVLLGLFMGVHYATLPPARPVPQSFVPKPPEGTDPFAKGFPKYGISVAPEDSAFFPASTRSGTGDYLPKGLLTNNDVATAEKLKEEIRDHGFAIDAKIGAEQCARCHADIVEQWSRSAHRFASFNNPFYRAAVEALRESEDGKTRSQWCAGCHDPAIMMAGNWKTDIDPTSPESQAGLTCLACHLMDEVHGVGGNGNYRINDLAPSPYLFAGEKDGILPEVHDLLVKSRPDVHKADLLKPVMRTSEYCGTCHKVSLNTPVNRYRWFRGQNEYDNHHDSGVTRNNARTFYLPPVSKSCQDCHMPLVDAPLGDVSAKNGKVRSHLFPGPNTALPHIRGDEETKREMERFLQEAKMRVDVFAVKQGERHVEALDLRDVAIEAEEDAEIQVVVRNQGVGHTFPGGTLDSNESWIHVVVEDAATPGRKLFESGAMDPATKLVDRDARFYRVVFVDEKGEECGVRNPQDFRAAAHLKVIGPGTADLARYGLRVPADWVGKKLKVTATLKWRKFMPHYVDFVWDRVMKGRPKPDLPVTDIASGSAVLGVVAKGAAPVAAPVDPERLKKEWVRWNDWGIGHLLQGDTRGAELAFGRIADADPKRVDGWRNLARTKLSDGAARAALDLLQKADACDPGNPQTAYFLGVALERLGGDLDAALAQFEKSRETFPNDRTIHRISSSIHYRMGRFEESLRAALRALAIDPEDREAHKLRMEAYGAMAADATDPARKAELLAARDEAKKAFDHYSIDESAQEWTQTFRRNRPDVHNQSLPLWVHPLRQTP